ncbi:hypothetical protein N7486_000683 [Penicillium sp. IBT 16267x]|nr:hypothetical protein N7486_000683 [Penicillium sp. IBT 16267x]
MKLTTFTSALALASSAAAAPSIAIEKRNPSGSFELVAYGVADDAIRMFYSDVKITDTELVTTATTSGVTLDSDTLLYIQPTADEVLPVGFTGNGIDAPSAATTAGFLFYGSYLMWEESDGILSDVFRLKETNVSGIYQFYWDMSSLDLSGYSFPTVKDKTV